VDWISLDQDRYRWRALVNGGNEPLGFHKMLENYRVAAQLVASRVVFSSTELVMYGWYMLDFFVFLLLSVSCFFAACVGC
jgi:hypothetical protein